MRIGFIGLGNMGSAVARNLLTRDTVRDRFLTAMATGMSESDWAAIARISYENAGVR